jgi:metal-responsive CopG/Arc/MetJ family transcriptional regulator
MVSSFRLTDKEEKLLTTLARRTGQSRSELVRKAIEEYGAKLIAQGGRSSLDRLMESGFEPIASGGDTDLSTNKEKQRKIILEKLTKRRR